MPTYTAINDTQIQPEAPVTSELMTLLRDNPIAVAEGDSGAPRVVSPALGLTFKTGSVSRTTSGTSTILTLDTTDLSNLSDMGVALLTGTVEAETTDTDGLLVGTIISNQVSTPPAIVSFRSDGNNTSYVSFSYLVELSSVTSLNLRLTVTTASGPGTQTATAYGQITILGR